MKWQGTAIWADESRLEDGSVGCAVARYDPEHDAWTGVRVCMGKNQEAYGAELHRPMLTLFQEPPRPEDRHLRRQPYRGLHPMHQAQDSDTLSRSRNGHTTYGSNEESPSNSGGSPSMQAPPATRRPTSGQRWQHGTNAGSEQLPYEFSSTSLAHLKRGITERKWVEACSWTESRLSQHHAYRPWKRMRPDPTPAKASKAVASRFYQLSMGRALIGPVRQARQRHLLVVRPRS